MTGKRRSCQLERDLTFSKTQPCRATKSPFGTSELAQHPASPDPAKPHHHGLLSDGNSEGPFSTFGFSSDGKSEGPFSSDGNSEGPFSTFGFSSDGNSEGPFSTFGFSGDGNSDGPFSTFGFSSDGNSEGPFSTFGFSSDGNSEGPFSTLGWHRGSCSSRESYPDVQQENHHHLPVPEFGKLGPYGHGGEWE
ncbi:uncharacterized protein LOC128854660 [Cuculus canorus]|uniref:uncharacterized protein LOC128854660 n=1 Tax=Cuculus canorus TaxID=55661 RepID=UPI0023AADD25|nr:uncharacterized protein LOC128854660 [Cuculus canorus]